MTDTLTPDERSIRMSKVRSKGNRSTELRMVHLMKGAGITGWRRGVPLPGKPDFVFRPAKIAIFIDGCFWHGCPRHQRVPKSNIEFWALKLDSNAKRDMKVNSVLRAAGWKVIRIWECDLKHNGKVVGRLKRLGL